MNRPKRFSAIAVALALAGAVVCPDRLSAQDCNANGIPDACDLTCGPAGGACDVPGCGTGSDCNANRVPDDCDAAAPRPAKHQNLCKDAEAVGPGRVYTGTTAESTSDGSAGCAAAVTSPDVWYRYTPAADGIAVVSLCGSSYDTALSVHTGCPGSSDNQIACNDDVCGTQSELSVSVLAGHTYLIRVAGYNGAVGSFRMNLTGPACLDCPGDCNGNGVPDTCDITTGPTEDCNLNLIPDECESAADCNQNGAQDFCDLFYGTSQDCDGNTVPDECEAASDCNANEVRDACELGSAFSVESGHLSPIGADSPQWFRVAHPPLAGGPVTMTLTTRADLGTKSPPCQCETLLVYFNDSYMGSYFQYSGHDCPATPDVTQATIPASMFNAAVSGGNLDIVVFGNYNVSANQCSPEPSFVAVRLDYQRPADCNGNGVLDECDMRDQTSADANGNLVPDECDPDCNGNGVPDDLDLSQGTGQDCDSNGVPDECDADMDQDDVPDPCDNCPNSPNGQQEDTDQDGYGDACDNCPQMYNPDQCDLDQDGIGDLCDPAPSLTTALQFYGGGTCATIPDAGPLHFGTGDFTVEMWVRVWGDGFLFDKRVDVDAGEVGYQLSLTSDGRVSFGVETPELLHNDIGVASTSVVADGQWHHVAGGRSGNQIVIYVDGIQENTRQLPSQMDLSHSGPVVLGSRHTLANYVYGFMDEIRFWSVARTADQIADTMHSSLRGRPAGLVGYWALHGGCGDQVLSDDSGMGGDGWLGSDPNQADVRDPRWVLSDAPVSAPVDTDGDGLLDLHDNCPDISNDDQQDGDGDRFGDLCDNCPAVANDTQANLDNDAAGDVCDDDDDGDGDLDGQDNCPVVANPDQEDADTDGVGDLCDSCPNTVPGATIDSTGCPLPIPGDFDHDGDVDQSDFGRLQACLSGSLLPQDDAACRDAKLDADNDVDHADVTVFLRCVSGPGVPATLGCSN